MFNILCCIVNQTLFLYITGLAVELVVPLSCSTAINLTFISANRDVCCVCVKLRCLYLCGLKYGLVGYVNIMQPRLPVISTQLATHSAWPRSVSMHVVFVYSVETSKCILQIYSPSGSHTVLVFHTKRER